MKTLVIFDSNNQDADLGVALDGKMKDAGWKGLDSFSYAYEKEISNDLTQSKAAVKKDVDAATFEAEWTHVKYVYVIGDKEPEFAVSPGDL